MGLHGQLHQILCVILRIFFFLLEVLRVVLFTNPFILPFGWDQFLFQYFILFS
jgi:hypothetical protein